MLVRLRIKWLLQLLRLMKVEQVNKQHYRLQLALFDIENFKNMFKKSINQLEYLMGITLPVVGGTDCV